MADGPKIIHPFSPDNHVPSSDELAYNASRWALLAKKELPASMYFIFNFGHRSALGTAKGVVTSNLRQEALRDEMRAIVKKWSDQRLVINPFEEN
jgi:hypothetical protein